MLVENGFAYCGNVVDTSELYLDLYAKVPFDPSDIHIHFGSENAANTISLRQLEPIPEFVEDEIWVTHGWQLGDAVPRETYSAAIHIVDSTGALVTQMDYGLPVTSSGCVTTAISLASLPAGEYTALVVVYAWESGERLPGWNDNTGETGERLRLGQFVLK
jgi:hypothetical protein